MTEKSNFTKKVDQTETNKKALAIFQKQHLMAVTPLPTYPPYRD